MLHWKGGIFSASTTSDVDIWASGDSKAIDYHNNGHPSQTKIKSSGIHVLRTDEDFSQYLEALSVTFKIDIDMRGDLILQQWGNISIYQVIDS